MGLGLNSKSNRAVNYSKFSISQIFIVFITYHLVVITIPNENECPCMNHILKC